MSKTTLDEGGLVRDLASPSPDLVGLRVRTGGLSIVAGLIHLWVTPAHVAEWWGYGLFFAAMALVQLAFGVLWLSIELDAGRMRDLITAGLVGHQALLLLYIATRTSGIPLLGPHAGLVEPASAIDIISKAVEVALMVQLVATNPEASEAGQPQRVKAV